VRRCPRSTASDLAVDPGSASPGDTVSITASTNFASQGPWAFLYPGAILVGQVSAPAGVLDDEIVVPPVAPGTYTLVVHDLGDNYGVPFTVEPGEGFTPLPPERIFDTRPGVADGLRVVPKQKIGGATELKVKVTDIAGRVPASGVGAVSMNVTVVQPEGSGYVTVYPCGTRPEVSSVNYVAGANVPNQVIAPVSADGEVCFYSFATTHLLADLNGYFPVGSGFTAVAPDRVFDTRPGVADGLRVVAKQKVGGATELKVKLTDIAGVVPATGVSAVSLNVTVAQPEGSGYVTVYPCGTRPEVSSVNYVAGQVVANAVIAPVSADGEICLYSFAPTHLLADINGYFPVGTGFTAVAPDRVFDTRPGVADGLRVVAKQKVGGATELKVKVTDIAGVVPATGVGAVSLNVTVAQPEGSGYATVYPCGTRPEASNLNYVAGQVVANAVIAPVSADGEICLYSFAPAHLLADINGYFPG
jgi:trimeric autotransporter adhesin